MSDRVVAIVQARLGSSRLPRKVLADIEGSPLLAVLLSRLAAARSLDAIVVATTNSNLDDELAEAVRGWGFDVHRGPSADVLSRYLGAAEASRADVVVRVTGDCPLIDPRNVDRVVDELLANDLDYVSLDERFADGADCEAFTAALLRTCDEEALLASEREHVTVWMRAHRARVATGTIENWRDDSGVRLTVDEMQDLEVVRRLVRALGASSTVTLEDYVDRLATDKEIVDPRAGTTRNEGLWRSRNQGRLPGIGLTRGLAESDRWLARALQVIPGATQTLSKGADQFVRGVTPTFIRSASGCYVTDVDGNEFIDYPMALGPIILGHGHPRTVEAVTRQIQQGSTFTLPHPIEVEVAEKICEVVPCAEMVKFAKNGSDATDGAVRLARAVTGKNVVLACGYHGWHDWYVIQTPRNAGVPAVLRPLVDTFPFNDIEALQAKIDQHHDDHAAVILEVGFTDPLPGYLNDLADRVHRAGGLVILDEIVTGFRFALGGAQELYGFTPDLACFGKAIANGLPLAAIVGRRDVMEGFDEVFFSGTFGGETLSLVAALATIQELQNSPVIEHIWAHGHRLHEGVRSAIERHALEVDLLGQPPRGAFSFRHGGVDSPDLRGLFLQETVRRGILFGGPIFVTYAHGEAEIDRTIEICDEAFSVLRRAIDTDSVAARLDGPAPGVVFRPTQD